MIEKLNTEDSQSYRAEVQLVKLNELIDKYNKLVKHYETHYHESLDTHYNTTGPKPGGLVEFDNPHND
jgi:hypothetical protein